MAMFWTSFLFSVAGLSEEMLEDGYSNITDIDISNTVAKQMTERYREKNTNITYKQMDVRQL